MAGAPMTSRQLLKLAIITTFIAAASSEALAAGAAIPKGAVPPESVKPYPSGINCIWKPRLRSGSFTLIDNQHLVLEGGDKKHYLLTLYNRCFDLDIALALRIDGHSDQLCGPGDSIVTKRDRCPIEYLEEVAGTSEAKAIVAARAAAAKAARQSH
jgi:Family of unknown function (DUF6491)